MHAIILHLHLQLLLAALGALLPLIPAGKRDRIAAVFDLAAKALTLGEGAAADLAVRLAAICADVECMAVAGERVTADRLDEAWVRVDAASRAFRAALRE